MENGRKIEGREGGREAYILQARLDHHLDIHPGNREDGSTTIGSSRDGGVILLLDVDALPTHGLHRVPGQEGGEVLRHT